MVDIFVQRERARKTRRARKNQYVRAILGKNIEDPFLAFLVHAVGYADDDIKIRVVENILRLDLFHIDVEIIVETEIQGFKRVRQERVDRARRTKRQEEAGRSEKIGFVLGFFIDRLDVGNQEGRFRAGLHPQSETPHRFFLLAVLVDDENVGIEVEG